MRVAILDIDAARAAAVAGSLPVESTSVRVDVGDTESVAAAAKHVEATLGACHLLCANVGVQQFGAIDRLTEGDWSWVVNVNILGTVRTVAAFLPLVRRSAEWRRILLTASSCVFIPGVRLGAYQTSKFAIQGYGETLRQELADEGIGVTLLFPAGMLTRHLESSAQAKPADKGDWVLLPDDVDAMTASRKIDQDSHVASPEHASRNVLADLLANEPYIITHGAYRAAYRARLAALETAFDRMERT
jgi:NAD(P)-dependent dehydrogenase (short-subunit alcohol dehydrogenase family)